MTKVFYECNSENVRYSTFSLSNAKNWVSKNGGSYKQCFDSKNSDVEGYCRSGAIFASDRWKSNKA